jgi:hypothetical protein
MELKLNEQHIQQINSILNSLPISCLTQVKSVIGVFEKAQAEAQAENQPDKEKDSDELE